MMRTGKEREEWDRIAFLLANIAALAGSKNVRMEDFHKFMGSQKGKVTKANIKSMRHMFPSKTKGV